MRAEAGRPCSMRVRETICPSSTFLFYESLDKLDDALWGPIFFTQSSWSSANVLWSHTCRHAQKPAVWAFLSLVKLTYTVHHHGLCLCIEHNGLPSYSSYKLIV